MWGRGEADAPWLSLFLSTGDRGLPEQAPRGEDVVSSAKGAFCFVCARVFLCAPASHGYAGDDRVSGQELWCGATLSGTEGCANVTELSAVAVANLMYGRVGPQLTIGGLTPRGFEKV